MAYGPEEKDRIEAFAKAMGFSVRHIDDPSPIEFNGWLTLWPPQAQAYEGQTGWMTGYVVGSGQGSIHGPPDADEVEIGEYPSLERALASLAAEWGSQEQEAADEQAAAVAEAAEQGAA